MASVRNLVGEKGDLVARREITKGHKCPPGRNKRGFERRGLQEATEETLRKAMSHLVI